MEIKDVSLNSYIKIYDDIFRKCELENFLNICENRKEFKDAEIVGTKENPNQVNKKIRDVKLWNLGNIGVKSLTDVYWANFFCFKITNYMERYIADTKIISGGEKITSMALLKYENNGHYDFHVDHGRTIPRTFSVIFLVNDNYKGGELCFRYPGCSQDLSVEKKSNRLIIWPSNFLYPHAVKPVTEGIRYSVVAWAL